LSSIGDPGRYSLPLQELMAMTRSSITDSPRLTAVPARAAGAFVAQ
jgi:hypothetical protein